MYDKLRNGFEYSMELVGDMDHVESCFSPFGDNVTVGAR
jgi:hypothetical protein